MSLDLKKVNGVHLPRSDLNQLLFSRKDLRQMVSPKFKVKTRQELVQATYKIPKKVAQSNKD